MRLSKEHKRFLEQATAAYQANLANDPVSLAYLRHERGLTDDAVRTFRLGSVGSNRPTTHDAYMGMISIPYITKSGIVNIEFRQPHECQGCSHPKYLSLEGSGTRLYNVNVLLLDTRYIGISEGALDALTATAFCNIPTVGVPGASKWASKPSWRRLFDGYERVLIFRDEGDAGGQFAKAVKNDLRNGEIVELPSKDVNRTYLDYGPGMIREKAGV